MPLSPRYRRAFSLVELLVVIAIIGMLVGLLLPAIGVVRESSRRSDCLNHLHQMGIALKGYHVANERYPIGCTQKKTLRTAWNTHLLSFVGEPVLGRKYKFDQAYNSAANRDVGSVVLPLFLCPSTVRYVFDRNGDTAGDRNGNGKWDPGDQLAFTDYGGVFGSANVEPFMNGVLLWDKAISEKDITDGLQYTLIVAEDSGRGPSMDGEWSNGENIFDVSGPINTQQDNEIWSDHPGGTCVLFCDGRNAFLSHDVPVEVLDKICTRAGSDPVSQADWER